MADRGLWLLAVATAFAFATAGAVRAAPFFSVDSASPSSTAVSNSAVLAPGPVGGPPTVATGAATLGLAGGLVDELDAMTAGGGLGLLHFSVSRASLGAVSATPDTRSEATAGQAAGDVFVSPTGPNPIGFNVLALNQDGLGLLPALPPGVAVAPPIDHLDALDLAAPTPLLISLAAGHPYLGTSVGCGSDLFVPTPAGPVLAVSHVTLALTCADDIDALHLDTVVSPGDLYFSLAPGSPSLAGGPPLLPNCGTGCSPADVFVAAGGVAPIARAWRAVNLSLRAADDVTALAFRDCPAPVGDADGDGVDDSCDSCLGIANPSQHDSDVDGYGNQCDADYDQNGVAGGRDFVLFRRNMACGGPGGARFFPHNDHDANGLCGGGNDFVFFRALFGLPPGPSGLACAGAAPCTF